MARERLNIDLLKESELDEGERIHVARYRFATRFAPGRRVLDAACGVGYGSCILARAGAASVLGVDISEDAVAFAREHYREGNLRFETGSAYDLSAVGEQDLVVSLETIEHIDKPRLFLDQIVRLLAADGMLVVSSPNRHGGSLRDKPMNPFHVQEWTDSEFVGMLSAYFRDVSLFGQRFYFQPLGFPGSRTAVRLLARAAAPGLLKAEGTDEVMEYPAQTSAGGKGGRWKYDPEITVAVCRGVIR